MFKEHTISYKRHFASYRRRLTVLYGGGFVALPNYGNLNSGFTISIWVANETDHGNSIMAESYVYFDNNVNSGICDGAT